MLKHEFFITGSNFYLIICVLSLTLIVCLYFSHKNLLTKIKILDIEKNNYVNDDTNENVKGNIMSSMS